MKKELRFYFIWILVVSNLFYQEYLGLNALIVAILTTLIFGWRFFNKPPTESIPYTTKQKWRWLFAASIWLTAAMGVFLGNNTLSIFLYLLALMYFISLQHRAYISFPLGLLQGFQSVFTGVARLFSDQIANRAVIQSNDRSRKIIRQVLQVSIGLIICIIFLKLYQTADPDFYELTKFLNLEWISWGFIIFYMALTWMLYGVYFYKPEPQLDQAENSLKNEINQGYSDKIESYFGVGNEKKLALITISILCGMLLLFLAMDVKFILNEYGIQRPVSEYSDKVHQGVNALIFSLVLVMILIAYFFRGSLNFELRGPLKQVAIGWLLLNCVVVVTTGMKNYDYILNFGFTYKRLGVMLYLFLCAIGLALSIYKIRHYKSIWFLFRSTSISFVGVFALVSLFNWNAIIAQYNLSHIKNDRLDLDYIYNLGPDAYPHLMDYYLVEKPAESYLYDALLIGIGNAQRELHHRTENTTWRSLNLRNHELYQKLKVYEPMLPEFDSTSDPNQTSLSQNF